MPIEMTIEEVGDKVVASVTGANPNEELYIELRSTPVPPNESTDPGTVVAALHRRVAGDGTTRFTAPADDFLLPDRPRVIVAIGPIADETFSS